MTRRLEKVVSELQRHAAQVIAQQFVEPKATATVTRADISPDLRNATVFVSVYGAAAEVLATRVQSGAPQAIAQYLAAHTQARSIPRIRVQLDSSGEYAEHISRLLKTIKED